MALDTTESDRVGSDYEPGPESRGGCGRIQAGRRWFVVVTNHGSEFLARDAIASESAKTGVVPFMPLDQPREIIRTNRAGRIVSRRSVPVPLLYRYLFCNFDPANSGWRRLYGTPGVERVLGMTPTAPQPIDPGFIEGMLQRASKEGVVPDVVRTMTEMGATLELMGHAWKSGAKGQTHGDPRVLVRISFHGFSWDAWMPGRLFAEMRG